MYNKHKNQTIVYQVIVDNQVVIQFNTEAKRDSLADRIRIEGRHIITGLTNIIYPGRNSNLTITIAE